ncbi:zinc ribbon domain protein [bacterium BMS3Abin07]|nr:zinc ribbon domain protein [bacterium BMS3Abin07]HDL20660.1 zinc ribbon domain-containing protein [Nitrospirota bacterium]HDO23044.1 zinc ribbon domain-containing protein [Nitrospirota bacterium]
MPIYEYRCLKCNKKQEFFQRFSDDPITTCPVCGGGMKKLVSANSFVLKGSGWYVTDYGTRKDKPVNKSDSSEPGKPDKKAEHVST